MRQHNEDFYDLFEDIEIDAPKPSLQEIDRQHARVLAKMGGTKTRRSASAGKVVLLAAAFATCLLAVAATYYSVNDLFRPVLKEQTPAGGLAPVVSMKPVVEKAGQIIDETIVSKGVSVSLRGVVGDASGFKAILDITDSSGKPIALKQNDGTYAEGNYRFNKIDFEPADAESGMGFGFGSSETVLSYTGDKLSLLIDFSLQGLETRPGSKYKLSLTDLVQFGMLPGTNIGMKPGDLYDIVNAFGAVSDGDFEVNGASDEDGDGVMEKKAYQLNADTAARRPLSADLPGYFVTNAALRDGVLYLRGIGVSEEASAAQFHQPALYNSATGETIAFAGTSSSGESWTLEFEGVSSPEMLKDYVIVKDCGEGLYPVLPGTWDFELDFTNEAVSETKPLSIPFQINGVSFVAEALTISPFYMHLNTSVASDENAAMAQTDRYHQSEWDRTWDAAARFAALTMKDGAEIRVPVGGMMRTEETVDFEFSFDVVIDPAQVESILFEGLLITLQ
ncbi:MAG: hypothetical protein LBU77_04945 [Clostridiales bacterium]|jgi:hypothetical protein|nr:hypothetical protein [Clostridiales bacterium]